MQVASEVYVLVEKWAAEQRRRSDGGLGYGQSCLAAVGEGRSVVTDLLPRGVSDWAGAFVLVDQVLKALNPLVADTLRLRFVERFSYPQIARRMACGLSTAERRAHDGLIRVQEAWMLGEVDFADVPLRKTA